MGNTRARIRCRTPVLALLLCGCYQSFFGSVEEDVSPTADDAGAFRDGSDGGPSGDDVAPRDDGGAVGDDGSSGDAFVDGRRDDAGGDAHDAATSGHLEPEGESESYYGTESGMEVQVHSGWLVPAAYSGSVYELIMDEDVPGATDDSYAAIYRLAPGGERLGTTWIDHWVEATSFGSICWTGEAFLAALPTTEAGIRVFGVDEDGNLLREPSLLPDHPESSAGGIALCPGTGPIILASSGAGDTRRLHRFGRDAVPDGTYADLPLPPLAGNVWERACAEAGDEIACITAQPDGEPDPPSIVFIARDGGLRFSAPLPDPAPCEGGNGCDIVFLGDGLGLVWSADEGGKPILHYARTDLDGNMTVGPVSTGRQVGIGPLGFHAATSGSTLFVVTEAAFGGAMGPAAATANLLALDGALLGDAVPVSHSCVWDPPPCTDGPAFWRGMAVFWEADAYSAIWNTWPDAMVAYRRFLVVP
ncbi:MAG: hypothetical protein HY907_21730 [Deltaproteobacteria bacterium]|nr:hypothetical protein [Deltaproteobacteria bacterium]